MHVGFEAAFQNRGDTADSELLHRELEVCLRAEDLGFDSVWLTEHHFTDYGLIADPLLALAYIAARTQHIRLGTAVTVLPWHDPVRLAEQVLLADHLSGGRIVLGMGRGLAAAEFAGLRVPLDESRERFDACARLLLAALSDGQIAAGALPGQPQLTLRPGPLAPFAGRMFSASVSPQSAPMNARLGLAPMLLLVKPVELLRADLDHYRATWAIERPDAGPPPAPLLSVTVVVEDTAEWALRTATHYDRISHAIAVRHYGMAEPAFGAAKDYQYYRSWRPPTEPQPDRPPATVVHGTPDAVLEQIDGFRRQLGLQGVLTIFHGIPGEDGERSLRLFADKCLPELRGWDAATTF